MVKIQNFAEDDKMSATAQQRMRIANEKAMKNVTHRGNVQKSSKTDQDKYPVSLY